MLSVTPRSFVAASLVAVLVVATAPAFAAPAPTATAAGLTGTVYSSDVATPLAGATVVATDANGVKFASQPTQADGAFSIAAVAPGRNSLSLETADGSFVVATPVTLAPGETRSLRLALRASSAKHGKTTAAKGGTGSGYTGASVVGMSAVILGFVAAGAIAVDHKNNDHNAPASGYQPPPAE